MAASPTLARYVLSFALAVAVSSACESSRQPMRPTPVADPMVGSYGLTLTSQSGCTGIPDEARNRTYAAVIEANGDRSYLVTLSEAVFLQGGICPAPGRAGLGCNQFRATRDGDVIHVRLEEENPDDEFSSVGGTIVEVTPSGNWLAFDGRGVGHRDGSTIEVSLEGQLWYCTSVQTDPLFCRDSVACPNSFRLVFASRR